jgi:hypothetical protein
MLKYEWNIEFKYFKRKYNMFLLPYSLRALHSCVEADEYMLLSDITNNNKNANIYALIKCFTLIPSINCIEYLIGIGTPLNETFEDNPFNCTPNEYLQNNFSKNTHQLHIIANRKIASAIERGNVILKERELANVPPKISCITKIRNIMKKVNCRC